MKNKAKVSRLFMILSYLLKSMTFSEFLATIKQALFKNELILVFSLDIDTILKNVSNQRGKSQSPFENVEIRKGTIAELNDFLMKTGFTAWEFRCHKLDGVKDFFIARDSETIQGITWIYYSSDTNRFLSLGQQDALLQYSLTLPQFRGRGLYPAILKAAANFLQSRGYRRVYILVERSNQPSINGILKAGFVEMGSVRLKKVLGFQVSNKINVSSGN